MTMNNNSQNISSVLEQVSISTLLACLGHKPAKIIGEDEFFFNVLRKTDAKPTFVVNNRLNTWYDRLTQKGGNLVDFGLAYWPDLNRNEVVEKIIKLFNDCQKLQNRVPQRLRKRKAQKIPIYQIEEIRPIGFSSEITAYLQSQGLWEMSIGRMKEVYYYFIDEKGIRKDFYAAGWPNENGGWEVISKNFSGCLLNKGMTFISGSHELIIFDDFLTYLSWQYANRLSNPSILILNYPEFIEAAKTRARKFHEVVFVPTVHTDE